MATFPGKPPNALGFKAELLLASTWTDITAYVMLRDSVRIAGMGRADETASIQPSTLTLTLKNDGRFTPKNTAGAYYPNIVRNAQLRISVNATSTTGVAYSGYRFWGEVAAWPPGYDDSLRDTYVQVTASGIWRRISQNQVPIGSCFWRYAQLLSGTSQPAAYWSMEDGSTGTGLNGFTLSDGTGTNMTVTSAPSYAADSTSFLGSNALPQPNGARLAANVTMASTPASFAVRFALSVPAVGDANGATYPGGMEVIKILTGSTVATISVTLVGNQLKVTGSNSGGTQLFTGTITTKVNGVPVYVSYEQTTGAWALKIIKPGAGAVLDQATGSGFSWTSGKVTQIQISSQGRIADTTIGQLMVLSLNTVDLIAAANNIGGQAGELATTRIQRLCTESNIPVTIVGSGGAAMGPQVSDTMQNILQSIEATDGGMLFETITQFGLGYRTLASMQNQAAVVTLTHTSGAISAPLAPTYDDQLVKNQWTVTNYDGYLTTAQLNSGAMSISPPPNGVGQGYAASKTINANTHAQVNAIAQQLLLEGTVDDVRYPAVAVSFQRAAAAPFFSSVPSMRLGDFFQISGLPAFLGGGTAKQLAWGYTETLGGEIPDWTITFNAIPELPFETSFSPGSFTNLQGAAGGVPAGSSVGSVVNGSQVSPGAVGASQAAIVLSARSIGGSTQFVAAATPYKWSFAVTGTPADTSYFICTPDQALAIAVGDTFSNTAGLGSPFTVTQVDQPAGTTTTVHFTPNATGVMSTGTVQGGTNGDQWVNSSAGGQINQWSAGVWTVLRFDGTAILNVGTITTNEIAANTITAADIAAGTIVAGIVNGTTISGAQFIAYGTTGEILVYSGLPASGNLIGSWSGAAGTDAQGNTYKPGVVSYQGTTVNQAAALVKSELDLYSNVTIQDNVNVKPSVLVANPTYTGEVRLNSGQVNSTDTQAFLQVLSAACTDPGSIFGSGSEIDVYASHFGITGNMFVQGAHGIFGRDAAWVNVGISSSWSARGGNYPPFQVYRTPLVGGMTLIRGALTSGSNSIANGAQIANFGTGYFNTSVVQYVPYTKWTGGAAMDATSMHLEITVGGAVNVWGISTAGTLGIFFQGVYFQDDLS